MGGRRRRPFSAARQQQRRFDCQHQHANFFGSNDWDSNGQTQISADAASGLWSIAGADFANYIYGIFFKDGNGTNLIWFVFNAQFTSGVWTTPFTEPPFDFTGASTSHEVSHYTTARVEFDNCPDCGVDPQIIDALEPATLALLGGGGLPCEGNRNRHCVRDVGQQLLGRKHHRHLDPFGNRQADG